VEEGIVIVFVVTGMAAMGRSRRGTGLSFNWSIIAAACK
jgi:hypothetical protein